MIAMTAGELEPGQVFIWFGCRLRAGQHVWRKLPGRVQPVVFLSVSPDDEGAEYSTVLPLDEAVVLVEPPRLMPLADASVEDVANAGKIMRRVPRGRLVRDGG